MLSKYDIYNKQLLDNNILSKCLDNLNKISDKLTENTLLIIKNIIYNKNTKLDYLKNYFKFNLLYNFISNKIINVLPIIYEIVNEILNKDYFESGIEDYFLSNQMYDIVENSLLISVGYKIIKYYFINSNVNCNINVLLSFITYMFRYIDIYDIENIIISLEYIKSIFYNNR